MNPYALQLGDQDPFEVIAATTRWLEFFFEAQTSNSLEEPLAPGKWNAREILCHLADCEIAFGFRLRQTLAEDHHTIQPFDQGKWAEAYRSYEARPALLAFAAVRQWNMVLIGGVAPRQLTKPVLHPERGEMTFFNLVETMAGHDLNHLVQLQRIAERTAARSE